MLCKMSKREIFSQTHRDTKRPKLDWSAGDRNFPENEGESKTWDDDIEDEVLIIASQVCEASFSSKNGTLPGYSICMQPKLTSTQICQPQTSAKNEFPFKIPTNTTVNNATTESSVRDFPSCNKTNGLLDFKGKTLDELYLQISHLQNENAKLETENINLCNKYRSKEGETKILRDNLLSNQKSIENLKLEHVHAQEQIQKQFNEKLSIINSEVESLKAQLDSKNLEIMNLKKRRALDSNNVKVKHVTVAANETIHRHLYGHSDLKKSVNDSGIQTDIKSDILQLKKPLRIGENKLMKTLPLILEEPIDEYWNLLDNNQNLQKQIDFAQSKCRIFNSIHRFPSTSVTAHKVSKPKLTLNCLCLDLAVVVEMGESCLMRSRYASIFKQIKLFLSEVLLQLETLAQRMTIAFQKECDQKYINSTAKYIPITRTDLLQAKVLHKDEQAVSARRATAVLSYIMEYSDVNKLLHRLEEISQDPSEQLLNLFCKICNLIDTCGPFGNITSSGLLVVKTTISTCQSHQLKANSTTPIYVHRHRRATCERLMRKVVFTTNNPDDAALSRETRRLNISCAVLYNGILVSIILVLEYMWNVSTEAYTKVVKIVKCIINCRPMYAVIFYLLNLVTKMSTSEDFLKNICNDNNSPKLRLDNDQGVLLYKRDTCVLQLLFKQTECALKCLARQELTYEMGTMMQYSITLYNNIWMNESENKNRCDCSLIIRQVLVYGLNLCANMLKQHSKLMLNANIELKALCRCGINLLYHWVLNDINFISRLSYHEGFYQSYVSCCRDMKDELELNETQSVMLAGLEDTLPIVADDVQPPSATTRDIWIHSFDNFNLTDHS